MLKLANQFLNSISSFLNQGVQRELKYTVRILLGVFIFIGLYTIRCSESYFGSLKTVSCDDFVGSFGAAGTDCESVSPPPNNNFDPKDKYLEFKYKVALGAVDIIFVVDNSSSMHEEHKNLSKQFGNFLNDMRNLDYRIAVITTDISNSPKNPARGRYYQDGRFIPIGGQPFLRNSRIGSYASDQDIDNFIGALVRPETLACDNGSKNKNDSRDDEYFFEYGTDKPKNSRSLSPCPSHDERGIYALNLAIENQAQRRFFRPGAHLMTVIISDEDERSSSGYINDRAEDGENYDFEDRDYPEALVQNVHYTFGPLKSFSVHSIIIPPRDRACHDQHQGSKANSGRGSGRGYYGWEYARISKARDKALLEYENLLRGNVISICSRKYGSQLGKIALYAGQIRASLPCAKPEEIFMHLDGRRSRLDYSIEGRTLMIEEGQVSLTSNLELIITCKE